MSAILPLFIPEAPPARHLVKGSTGDGRGAMMSEDRRVDCAATKSRRLKKKRVVTEARKEQNRMAQRNYRLRQKEKNKEDTTEIRQLKRNYERQPKQRRCLRPKTPATLQQEPKSTKPMTQTDEEPEIVNEAVRVHDALISTFGELGQRCSMWLPMAMSNNKILEGTASQRPSSCSDSATPVQSIPGLESFSSSSPPPPGSSLSTPLFLADPYRNAINFLPTDIFSAIIHNATALNFDLSILVSCANHCPSPMYVGPASPSENPERLLSKALDRLRSNSGTDIANAPPADLMPTLTQLTVPHHASLDLIPLPLLRDRAILLCATMPTTFNLWELKQDIYVRGGLVVWRNSCGRDLGGDMSFAGQPWEMRSWEATPWFLRKWSLAVDGDEGQLGKQSRSWRWWRERLALPAKAVL